jgi:hypothetical protein
VHGSYVTDVLPTLVLLGIGVGLSFAALMTLAMSGATPSEAGLASGLVNTTAQVGGALGLAVLNTLAATRTHHLLAHGISNASALTSGYHLAYLVSGGLVIVAIAIAAWVLESVPAPTAAPADAPVPSTTEAYADAA